MQQTKHDGRTQKLINELYKEAFDKVESEIKTDIKNLADKFFKSDTKQLKVLDIGCGRCPYKEALRDIVDTEEKGHLVLCDIDKNIETVEINGVLITVKHEDANDILKTGLS